MAIPKILGRDFELSTTGIDARGRGIESWRVADAVLAEVGAAFEERGLPVWTARGGSRLDPSSTHSTEEGRRWLANGQSVYCDMGHVEPCTAETLHPRRFSAQCLAALRVAEIGRGRAEERAEPGTRFRLSTATVDLEDPAVAWGAHLNVAVTTELWEDLFLEHSRPARLGFVASALAAAIPFFGAGYVRLHDHRPRFSLSARAHHLTRLHTLSTTEPYARGILNTRREPHSSDDERLHLIGFDLALVGAPLLATFVQCTLLAAEAGFCGLNLAEPVEALRSWSSGFDPHSSRVPASARLASGRSRPLAHYVRELVRAYLELLADGRIEERHAPDASANLQRILELTHDLEQGDLERCARHLDWAAKFLCLRDLCLEEGLTLAAPEVRLLDHDFASTDPARGLFWRLWEEDLVDPMTTPAEVEAALDDGPEDGRGWVRGRVIRRFLPRITAIDWSRIELEHPSGWGRLALWLEHPQHGRSELEPLLALAGDDVEELERLLDATRFVPAVHAPAVHEHGPPVDGVPEEGPRPTR